MDTTRAPRADDDTAGVPVPAFAWRPVALVAAVPVVILAACIGRYGYHRDELYFLDAGRHLAWGYPDQPPLLPLLAHGLDLLPGPALPWLRVPGLLIAAACVLLGALTAREMGGGRRAQVLTAVLVALFPITYGLAEMLTTATLDGLCWVAITWLLVRWIRVRDGRLLFAVGLVAAVDVQVKWLVLFLMVGLLAGVLAYGPRAVLRSPWLWAGGAVAAISWVPGLVWQARHGWPQIEMGQVIASHQSFGGRPLFVPMQILFTGVVPAAVWLYGLVMLWRAPRLRAYRFVGVAYLVLLVFFVVTGGQAYYLFGLYPALWAAGAVAWTERPPRAWLRWTASPVALAITFPIVLGLSVPLYPVSVVARTPLTAINTPIGETVGWPRFVAAVDRAYRTLPPADRSTAVVLTSNYGEAGAVNRLGPPLGLPHAYSGHNAYWYWGPPPVTRGAALVIGSPEYVAYTRASWTDCRVAARIDNGVDLDNEEQGYPILACRGPKLTWARIWPTQRHLG
ncbi:MAG TPA: glycosyltransferase family 39 protein [Streptosporangiaceae bacterium]